jgi:uncharacterized damage-inducible protein DinB
MAINDAFIAELKHESGLTKNILERVPLDKKDWKPHEKSMTLGRLATHIAEIPRWVREIINIDEYDFLAQTFKPRIAGSQEDLISIYQEHLGNAIGALETQNDDEFNKTWTLKRGNLILLSTPKKVAIRGWAFSHMIHHRGQLSVYLRLLDVPVPGLYGPSADEK